MHAGHEVCPLPLVMEIVHEKEAPALKVLSQPRPLLRRYLPVPDRYGQQKRQVEDFITVDVDDGFNGFGVNPSEPAQQPNEEAVALVRVDPPTPAAVPAVIGRVGKQAAQGKIPPSARHGGIFHRGLHFAFVTSPKSLPP